MPIVTIANLEKTFGKRVIFDQLDFLIDRGERVGLIGANGSGKTTLFRVLNGEVTPDQGVVAIAKSIKLGYLTQDPVFDADNSVIDEAELAFAELHGLSHRLRDLEHAMGELVGEELERVLHQYQSVQHEFELAGGYAWQHTLEATLLGVGLTQDTWQQNVASLSGGQRSRLALAKLLISQPDLLLLDEPTNHLDLAAIEWLEKYLLEFSGAVLIISHDRYLLDRLATRIAWLTENRLRSYPGNYSAFVEQRQLQELSQQRAYEQQQADIAKQQEFVRRFGAGQRSREAKGRDKRLQRLLKSDEMIQQVQSHTKINLSLESEQRAGDQVLDVRELSKAYERRVLWNKIGFHVCRGERIGIIGPNGSGKTTLLEVLLGRRDADDGVVKWGANLNLGYYDQRLDDFDGESTVIEEVAQGRFAKEQELRDVLALMLFRGDDIYKPVGLLSGGERARVRLAQLLLDKPNVLILDEPTNHLDIASAEGLEGALRDFPGTVLCVSHDRYFLDRVAHRLLVLQPPGMRDFAGNYSAWVAKLIGEQAEAAAESAAKLRAKSKSKSKPAAARPNSAKSAPPAQREPRKDNPYLRPYGQLSIKELERLIGKAEQELEGYQRQFSDPSQFRDPQKKRQLQEEYDALTAKLEALETEYISR